MDMDIDYMKMDGHMGFERLGTEYSGCLLFFHSSFHISGPPSTRRRTFDSTPITRTRKDSPD